MSVDSHKVQNKTIPCKDAPLFASDFQQGGCYWWTIFVGFLKVFLSEAAAATSKKAPLLALDFHQGAGGFFQLGIVLIGKHPHHLRGNILSLLCFF